MLLFTVEIMPYVALVVVMAPKDYEHFDEGHKCGDGQGENEQNPYEHKTQIVLSQDALHVANDPIPALLNGRAGRCRRF